MPSLADIAPQLEKVTVGGTEVEVHGVGIDAVARVLGRSSALRAMLTGSQLDDPLVLIGEAPDAAHALMVEAMRPLDPGEPFDLDKEIAGARRLPFGDQVTLIEKVFTLSFPGGVTPFFERLVGLLGPGGVAGLPGRGQGTSSPQPSTNLSPTATQ